jgi:hypothetical protein
MSGEGPSGIGFNVGSRQPDDGHLSRSSSALSVSSTGTLASQVCFVLYLI